MKQILLALLLAMAVGLSGCGKKEAPPLESAAPPPPSSSEENEKPPLVEAQPGEPAIPVDAALYRGQVESVEERDGARAVVLNQVAGTDFGSPTLTVLLDDSTRAGFDLAELAERQYLEVYYGGTPEEGGQVRAIAANLLPEAEMSVFNGAVEEILEGAEGRDLLLESLDGKGKILFHLGDETQVYLDGDGIQPGDKLNIYFSGITTRSEPPQATALEVYPYAEPA